MFKWQTDQSSQVNYLTNDQEMKEWTLFEGKESANLRAIKTGITDQSVGGSIHPPGVRPGMFFSQRDAR